MSTSHPSSRINAALMTTLARSVLQTEADAILALIPRIDESFVQACTLILDCSGRTVVTGMGKSGHIGKKIAATLASTGTPAFFMHPGEANHGDMGMLTANDVVLLLSNSGNTDELQTLLPAIKRLNVPLIALTGNPSSPLAQAATVHLDISVKEEACPLGLAPTASTTATLALGDALAVSLLDARGFTEEDFARSHPAGKLGRKLLLTVRDIMHQDNRIPKVHLRANLREGLLEMSTKGLGMTAIVDDANKVCGIFTDGDLRRALNTPLDLQTAPIQQYMTPHCVTLNVDSLAVSALTLMENKRINALLITTDDNTLVGALNMHDLLRAQVI